MNRCILLIALAGMLILPFFSEAQTRTLSGTVNNEDGSPLPGATVRIREISNLATITDAQGHFQLQVPEAGKTLVVSYIGMQTMQIPIENREHVTITLQPASHLMSDVVVIGYGAEKRADVSSSIASLKASAIQGIPEAGVDQMLQGKVPGVTVSANTGQPGGGVAVRIRGITSVNGSNPLYVIDGVPILTSTTSTSQDQLGGVPGQNVQSVLATLNPNDIASIDILKDASAQAIYGSLGANGVILITTKHGLQGQEGRVSYDVYTGWNDVAKKLPLMNLQEYARYYNSVIADFNYMHQVAPNQVGTLDSIGEFKYPELLGEGTNWQDAIFQTGHVQNHQLSFSGSHNRTTYYFSGNYFNQTGTVIGSWFRRYAGRISIDQQVKSWLKAGFSSNLSKTEQKVTLTDGQQSVISVMLYNSPATPVKDLNGNYLTTTNIQGVPFGDQINPVALALLRDVRARQQKAFGNAYVDIQFTPDLDFRNQLNYDYQLTQNTAFQPNIFNPYGNLIIGPSRLREDRGVSLYWGLQSYLTYNHAFGKHQVNIVAGHEAQESNYDGSWVTVTDLTLNIESLAAGTIDPSQTGGGKYQWAMESYFARANYTYDNRYSVSLSLRRDGSSSFGPEKRWGNFPAVSAAWTVTNESFARNWRALSYLKLRAGYGAVGNQNSPVQNAYSTNIRLATNAIGLFGQNNAPGVPANAGNPALAWESVITYNAGLDGGLLQNRIEFTVDVYKKTTSHTILSVVLPGFAGLDPNPPNNSYQDIEPPVVNAGRMTNTGIDISLTSHNIQSQNLKWNTTVVFSHYRNMLNSLTTQQAALYGKSMDFAPQTLTVTTAGHPVGSFYGFVTDGLYRTMDDLNKGPQPMLPVQPTGTWLGDIRYKDLDGDGKITNADQTFIGNPNPKFTYSISNTLQYKGFDLTIFLNGVYGDQIYNYSRMLTESLFNVYQNQLNTVMDRYTSSNPNGKLPRYNQWNNNNLKISDRFIESGSYLRIQDLTIGYTFPEKWISQLKMTGARVYISAHNLYTFTRYSGYDPELGAFNNNVLLMNVDYGHYPVPRSFTAGASIQF